MALLKRFLKKLKAVFTLKPSKKPRRKRSKKRQVAKKPKAKKPSKTFTRTKQKKKISPPKRSRTPVNKRIAATKKKQQVSTAKKKAALRKKSAAKKKSVVKKKAVLKNKARPPKSAASKRINHRIKTALKPAQKPSGVKQKKAALQKKPAVKPEPSQVLIAHVTHYFSKISVVVLEMQGGLSKGDMICIKGKETNFSQRVDSLQIESVDVLKAKKGQLVGLKTKKKCRVGDQVYKQ